MPDEVFNPSYRYPGQSVPTPDAPIISTGFNQTVSGDYPDAPIIPVAGGGDVGNQGSIDPAADRVMSWWMSQDAQAAHGLATRMQFDPQAGAMHRLNNWSLSTFKAPWYMPSGSLFTLGGRVTLFSLAAGMLGFALPPVGKKTGARVAWALGGLLFPTITVGAVATKQLVK